MTISAEERTARVEVLTSAVDWFDKNPHLVVRHVFAANEIKTRYLDPHHHAAECFCILGRLIREANIHVNPEDVTSYGRVVTPGSHGYEASRRAAYYDRIKDYIAPFGIESRQLFNINDNENMSHKEKTAKLRLLLIQAVVGDEALS